MNKIIILVVGLFLSASFNSFASINGTVKNYKHSQICLFKVTEGELTFVEQQQINADSTFSFTYTPESASCYYLGAEKSSKSFFGGVFLTIGQSANLIIDSNKLDFSSHPNKWAANMQQEWINISYKYYPLISDYRRTSDSIGMKETVYSFESDYTAFKKKINTPNNDFNKWMSVQCKVNFENEIIRTLTMSMNGLLQHMLEYDALKTMHAQKFTTADLLLSKDGSRVLSIYSMLDMFYKKQQSSDHLANSVNKFDNDTLKGKLVTDYLIKRKISGKYYSEIVNKYNDYIVTDHQKTTLADYENTILKYAEGADAFDFTYPDTKGKLHSLSDYTGNVVLVDVWATWCAPCKSEIPHLEKLIHDYEGKDVVFISVSINIMEQKKEWKEFVKKENLEGVQLLADKGFKSQILLDYKITGVPRFMLFDKKGKIVSVTAARPSHPDLRKLIDHQLTK